MRRILRDRSLVDIYVTSRTYERTSTVTVVLERYYSRSRAVVAIAHRS